MRLICAVLALFLCASPAFAGFAQTYIPVVCTDNPKEALDILDQRQQSPVWRKDDAGGGRLVLFQNTETGKWTLTRIVPKGLCIIATSPEQEGTAS